MTSINVGTAVSAYRKSVDKYLQCTVSKEMIKGVMFRCVDDMGQEFGPFVLKELTPIEKLFTQPEVLVMKEKDLLENPDNFVKKEAPKEGEASKKRLSSKAKRAVAKKGAGSKGFFF